jgi:predicted proteasome-type protease
MRDYVRSGAHRRRGRAPGARARSEGAGRVRHRFQRQHHLWRPDRGERCRLFQIYSAGNFIESHDENTYFQIGEAKYGKPIIDRVVGPATSSTMPPSAR